MIYVLYFRLHQLFTVKNLSTFTFLPANKDLVLWEWMGWRNTSYLLLLLDLVLAAPASIIYFKRNNFPKLVKIWYHWFLLLLFVTFSYALAGLVTDIVITLITLNWSMLKSLGAPVGPTPL